MADVARFEGGKEMIMSTGDPTRHPSRVDSIESLRQDIESTRAALAETLRQLNDRVNPRLVVRRRAERLRGSPLPVLGAAVVLGAASAAAFATLGRPRRAVTPARAGIVGGIAALGTGVVAYAVTARRRRRTNGSDPMPAADSPGTPFPDGDSGTANPIGLATAADPAAPPITSDTTQVASAGARLGPSPPGGDVVDLLIAQHGEVEALFDHVLRAAPPNDRREAFAALVSRLQRHERAEQEIVHPALRALGGPAADAARARLDEENQADRLLTELIGYGVTSRRFPGGLEQLRHAVIAHAEHEETIEFPLLRARLDDAHLRDMANQVRATQRGTW
jgi:hemerythrin superfamily protein